MCQVRQDVKLRRSHFNNTERKTRPSSTRHACVTEGCRLLLTTQAFGMNIEKKKLTILVKTYRVDLSSIIEKTTVLRSVD